MQTISRSDFQKAIEAGIAAAPQLTPLAVKSLKWVGQTANRTYVGSFVGQDNIRCPASQAMLFPTTPINRDHTKGCLTFATTFDEYVWKLFDREFIGAVEVV